MTDLPDLKVKALVSFPATILDGKGIDVTKQNGNFKFDLAFDDFAPPVSGVTDPSHQNVLLWNSVTGAYTLAPITITSGREVLVAPRTYYVRTDGSDLNNGLADSASGAFLTFQRALDFITLSLDLSGQTVTITHGNEIAKTFIGQNEIRPWVGGGALIIKGNGAANTFISATGQGFNISSGALPGPVTFQSMKIAVTANGILINSSCNVNIGSGMEFGACNVSGLTTSVGGGVITIIADLTISGGGNYSWRAVLGQIVCVGRIITLTGSPVFSTAFARSDTSGDIASLSCTFNGVTGASSKRYSADMNGVINTFGSGVNYFPGNVAGTVTNGGLYI